MTPYYNSTLIREKVLELIQSPEAIIRFLFGESDHSRAYKILAEYWNAIHQFAFNSLKYEISEAIEQGKTYTPQLVYDTIKRLEEEYELGSTIHIGPEPESYLRNFAKSQFLWIGENKMEIDKQTLQDMLEDWAND